MAENSNIAWTDHTFNPWIGCQPVSPACDHCYARDKWGKRTGNVALWEDAPPRRTTAANWDKPFAWNRRVEAAGRRERVFCASLADVFDDRIPWQWREDLWALIWDTPCLDWLILTKRPENIADMLPGNWGQGWDNVWLGVTVENQVEEARRVPILQATPATRRFISCEPLLEQVKPDLFGIDLVICGGESGGQARLMFPSWAEELLHLCRREGVDFFMKQMGDACDKLAKSENIEKDPEWDYIPLSLRVREFPGYTTEVERW